MPSFVYKLLKKPLSFPEGEFKGDEVNEMLKRRTAILLITNFILELIYSLVVGGLIFTALYFINGSVDTVMILLSVIGMLVYWLTLTFGDFFLERYKMYHNGLMTLVQSSASITNPDDEAKQMFNDLLKEAERMREEEEKKND